MSSRREAKARCCHGERRCTGRCGECDWNKCERCCKSFAAYLFSTIGLVMVLVGYASAGGSLFLWLEEEREKYDNDKVREMVESARKTHAEALWNITERLNILYKENWTAEADRVLRQLEAETFHTAKRTKWDGLSPGEPFFPKWTFADALFYAITVITTIGYGHVTPVTKEGQICTMFYALIGIPLTVMCMANVGKFFASLFKLTYHAVCCGVCCLCCPRHKIVRGKRDCEAGQAANKVCTHIKEEEIDSTYVWKDTFAESSYTGINGAAPAEVTAKGCNGQRSKESLRKSSPRKEKREEDNVGMLALCRRKIHKALVEQAPVPAYLCLVIMTLYIVGGALLFSLWEGWDFISGTYFCFVTLTTIGFGDLVPGATLGLGEISDWDATSKLLICAMYLFFGLSLVAMCFDLMREDVYAKLVWVGKKIGILKNDDETNSSDSA